MNFPVFQKSLQKTIFQNFSKDGYFLPGGRRDMIFRLFLETKVDFVKNVK